MQQIYGFEIILKETLPPPVDLDQLDLMANRLCESGCDDCVPSTSGGVITIGFDRSAESLGQAIDSAMADIRNAGYTPSRLVVEELVQVAS